MELREAIELLLAANEPNVQLDIFRDNGQVVLQGYQYRDVKKWGLGIDFGGIDGVVFELLFNKSKTDNRNNFERFQESLVRKHYSSFKAVEQNSYFSFFPSTAPAIEINDFVMNTLNEVYGDTSKLDFRLAAF